MILKWKAIKRFLQTSSLLFFVSGCSDTSNAEKDAIAHLEKKYGIPFEIIESSYEWMNKRHYARARSLNAPIITFGVTVQKSGRISDFYTEVKYQKEASQYLKKLINKLDLNVPFSVKVHSSSNIENLDFRNLPAWEKRFLDNPQGHELHIKINFFSEPDDVALMALLELDRKFRAMALKKVGFTINFFDAEALSGNPVEKFEFGYNTSPEYFESQKRNFFKARLLYYIDPSKEDSPTKKQLLEIMKYKFISSLKFNVL